MRYLQYLYKLEMLQEFSQNRISEHNNRKLQVALFIVNNAACLNITLGQQCCRFYYTSQYHRFIVFSFIYEWRFLQKTFVEGL